VACNMQRGMQHATCHATWHAACNVGMQDPHFLLPPAVAGRIFSSRHPWCAALVYLYGSFLGARMSATRRHPERTSTRAHCARARACCARASCLCARVCACVHACARACVRACTCAQRALASVLESARTEQARIGRIAPDRMDERERELPLGEVRPERGAGRRMPGLSSTRKVRATAIERRTQRRARPGQALGRSACEVGGR
jgi:hypothetical protein